MPNRRYVKRRSARDARYIIERSLRELPQFGNEAFVDGKIQHIHDGLWHQNFCCWIEGAKDKAVNGSHFLRLLDDREDWHHGPEPRERLLREAQTLRLLRELSLQHPTPEFVCFVSEGDEPLGMIETTLNGAAMDKYPTKDLLKHIASVAASIHSLSTDRFSHLPQRESRKQHLLHHLNQKDKGIFEEFETAREVRDWINEYTPSSSEVALLHGDLLPQNILIFFDDDFGAAPTLSVVDWEMATIGDPAYDLAIVSRGRKKVQREGSLNEFVKAYVEAGGAHLTTKDVRAHELLLVLGWLVDAWLEHQKPTRSGHAPKYYVEKLKPLLRRVS